MAEEKVLHPHPHPHAPAPAAGAQQPGPPPGPPPAQLAASAIILDALPVNTVPFVLLPQPPRELPPNLPPNVQAPPPPLPKLVCPEHKLEKCGNCTIGSGSATGGGTGVDFERINRLGYFMAFLAPGMVPPPPNVQFGKNADAIKQMRERGNTHFQARPPAYPEAIKLYTQSINGSFSRPLWEAAGFTKDEVVAALLNRSAAFAGLGDWPAAYADADASVKLDAKKSKAYFRKAKALVEMSRLDDAHEVVLKGLQADPANEELVEYAKKLKDQIDAAAVSKGSSEIVEKKPDQVQKLSGAGEVVDEKKTSEDGEKS